MKPNLSNFIFTVALFSAAACGVRNSEKAGNKEVYQLVWADEFDYAGLPDSGKWSYDTEGNSSGWGNNEAQFYTKERLENAEVKDGMLHITARKEVYENKEYTSARLITKGKGDWLYGKFEVKARLPEGRGLWPAIWMLPTDWEYGNWPASGEIDIMENVGYMPDTILATAHTKSYNHVIGTQKSDTIYVPTCYDQFHVYKLEWEPGEYKVFVDDVHFFTFKNEGTGFNEWPFDKRFHLLLNVAVGGNWGGQKGIDEAIFPRSMIVDYVRVYQKK
ncbi:MAG: glycoside hydrolase [Bacteroidetes bacterium GWF2_42_66]|nr:MAG: glycoside hydrolase [Bacteroidetes bacterium GWA2_42_15]OFX95965.1 MAG: glycoside hydrolase [Bacteroidetes bacterium GWE2_42_39]OFY46538.1 MAG: glycoside hydrolase [Bacteroidetes bacterium GWF2_42_66]HBL75610.1 glycoside hydrolase [Prolixibacteraceae bacterium]HCR91018.1 glycoside hydrolase [Prolixibacteraceae bacterium]